MSGPTPTVVRLDDVWPVSWGGREASRFLLRAHQTDGLFSFYESSVPPGVGSPTHLHEAMDETFCVLAGTLSITVGERRHEATPGTMVYVPRGIMHSFANRTDTLVTMLCIVTPGGIEDFFEELSDLVTLSPEPDVAAMNACARRHRIQVQGPGPVPAGIVAANPGPRSDESDERTTEMTDMLQPAGPTDPAIDEPVAEVEMPPTPALLRPLFKPRTKPPSRTNRAINKGFVRVNVSLFRRSHGKLGGRFLGMDTLLLTTLGRRTGQDRTSVVNYLWDQGRFVICAAYGGEMVNPAWYLNLQALGRATAEIGQETLEVTARTLPAGPERDALWARLVQVAPNYARYQAMTTRLLPVVVLTPVDL